MWWILGSFGQDQVVTVWGPAGADGICEALSVTAHYRSVASDGGDILV